MQVLKDRRFAYVVLAVCVIISILGFGGGKLADMRSEALTVFTDGTDPDEVIPSSMDVYLDNAGNYLRTMASEVKLRAGADNADAARALELADVLDSAADMSERHAALDESKALVENMYNAMEGQERTDFDRAYKNYKSELRKMELDGYHQAARDYNAEIDAFPANIIGTVTGNGKLDTF